MLFVGVITLFVQFRLIMLFVCSIMLFVGRIMLFVGLIMLIVGLIMRLLFPTWFLLIMEKLRYDGCDH